ncbi:tyrosine-type recombinase/integrase [Virgibacillus salexigens]|uniref:tyrosine-type recombinase/integrase n=1 Tax=Virgibacillus salexigens TaxID=61016 RepID=UPI00190B8E5B|nr:tyrosine-type recombinase/integrase [Virgibacillus salexigens]
MLSFQKRGKTWQYTISAKPKPIRKSGFRTKKEAQVAAAEMENKLNKGHPTQLKSIPFSEYFENWIGLYKTNISETTLRHYQYSLTAVKRYFDNTPIQNITRQEYQKFINFFGGTRAKETVEKLNSHCRACVKDAVEDRLIPFDFTRKVNLTWTVKAKKREEKHLSYEDSKKLFNELLSRLNGGLGYYLLLLGISTGFRFGELVGLTRKDFDFENNTINIDKTWAYLERQEEGFGPTKNEESVRVVKVDKVTMSVFKELFNNSPPNIHQLVFYSPSSKYHVISNTNANKLLRKTLKEMKIDPITIHGLRHTHASVLLYQKVSMNYVSERLGHKDVETTWKTYAHILNEMRTEDERETVSIFERMLV